VIEYSDLECPFCSRVHPVLQQLIRENPNVMWVYRHFPLGPHQNAQKAAEAVECAGALGTPGLFWDMTDLIFDKGPDNAKLADLAVELGLDRTAFEECLSSVRFAAHVQEEMGVAQRAGVNGTPTHFVVHLPSGRIERVVGAQPIEAFTSAIARVQGE
jgi:protein-disulfide isomerase